MNTLKVDFTTKRQMANTYKKLEILKMKKNIILSISMAVALSTTLLANAQADDSAVNTKIFLGNKTINSDAWSAQDSHGTVGLLTDFHTGFHGIRVAVDLFGSGSEEDTTSQVKGTYTAQANLGIRKYFDLQSKFEPFVGGGINLVNAYQNNNDQNNNDGSATTEEEDMGSGLWLNGGVDYFVNDNITLGVDLRYSTADVELYGQSVNLNALTTGVFIGYRL